MCAARGYDLVLTLPQGMSREREGLLRLYGAQVQVTESLGGMNEAVAAAQALAARPRRLAARPVLQPRQPGGAPPHHRARDLGGARRPASTTSSPASAPAARSPAPGCVPEGAQPGACKIVAVEPAAPPCCPAALPGPHKIQGIGAGFVPPVLDRELLDEIIPIDDEDAIETARLVARREGVLGGISCGAAVAGALQIAAREEARGARIAVVLPDSGERYVSTPFFAPEPERATAT